MTNPDKNRKKSFKKRYTFTSLPISLTCTGSAALKFPENRLPGSGPIRGGQGLPDQSLFQMSDLTERIIDGLAIFWLFFLSRHSLRQIFCGNYIVSYHHNGPMNDVSRFLHITV